MGGGGELFEYFIGYAPKVKCVPKFAAQFERDPMCNGMWAINVF